MDLWFEAGNLVVDPPAWAAKTATWTLLRFERASGTCRLLRPGLARVGSVVTVAVAAAVAFVGYPHLGE